MRKIIQITASHDVDGDSGDIASTTELYALCDDGTILFSWFKVSNSSGWQPWKICDIPPGDLPKLKAEGEE